MIRVFLADEFPVVLAGLHRFLGGTEFQVVGEATTRQELLQGLAHCCPHIVLIDADQQSFADLSEGRLPELLAEFQAGFSQKCRWTFRVVELSPSLKSAPKEEILETLRRVSPKRISSRGTSLPSSTAATLTPREISVLQLIVQGKSNKEIAKTLAITVDTVKEHVHNILVKTSNSDRTQAALWAVRNEVASL